MQPPLTSPGESIVVAVASHIYGFSLNRSRTDNLVERMTLARAQRVRMALAGGHPSGRRHEDIRPGKANILPTENVPQVFWLSEFACSS
jgi:hypothetical protein